MPDAATIDALHRLLGHPSIGYAIAIAALGACVWLVERVVNTRNETLREGNRTLEQIQANMAVHTVRQAEGVEAMRAITANLERLNTRIENHDRDEETRHRETIREIRDQERDT